MRLSCHMRYCQPHKTKNCFRVTHTILTNMMPIAWHLSRHLKTRLKLCKSLLQLLGKRCSRSNTLPSRRSQTSLAQTEHPCHTRSVRPPRLHRSNRQGKITTSRPSHKARLGHLIRCTASEHLLRHDTLKLLGIDPLSQFEATELP